MITADDILKIQSELTEEQIRKLVYYLTKDHIQELKELARKKTIKRFVKPMRKSIENIINNLYDSGDIKKESINLLNQCYMSLKNAHNLIKNRSIVDANTILRSAFENLIMAMMIDYDDNVYREFIDLSINDITRNLTKPQKLRNNFRKVLKKLDVELFSDLNSKKSKDLLDEFYDKLCLFTHSSLIVNAMVELKKDKTEDLYVFAIKQNVYFIELLLCLCLKYLSDDKKDNIELKFVAIGYFVILSDINKDNVSNESVEKLKKYLYFNINEDFINKNNIDINYLKQEIEDFQKEIEINSLMIIEIIKEILN